MSLKGYGLTTEIETEIVSAYAAALQHVPAVTAAPGWFAVGSFFLPKSVQARLEIIGGLSAVGLVGAARLYDPTPGVDAPVSGSDVAITGTDAARYLSGAASLVGGRVYTVQVQVTGATGGDKFGTVQTASLVGV